jgi:hypothetical protein
MPRITKDRPKTGLSNQPVFFMNSAFVVSYVYAVKLFSLDSYSSRSAALYLSDFNNIIRIRLAVV